MKLHLPKVLFTAVVAAVCCVQQAYAADYYITGVGVNNGGTPTGTFHSSTFQTTDGKQPIENGHAVTDQWRVFSDNTTATNVTADKVAGDHTLILNADSGAYGENQKYTGDLEVQYDSFAAGAIKVLSGTTITGIDAASNKNRTFYIGGSNEAGYNSVFERDFTLNPNSGIVLNGTQTWTISNGKTVKLVANTVTNSGTTTLSGGTVSVNKAFDNNGTLNLASALKVNQKIDNADGTVYTTGSGKIVVDNYLTYTDKSEVTYSDTATGNGFAKTALTVIDGGTIGDNGSAVAVQVNGQNLTTTDGVINFTSSEYWVNQGTVTVGGDSASTDTASAASYILNGAALNVTANQSVSISAINAKSDLTIGNGATASYKSADATAKALGAVSIDGGTLKTQVTTAAYSVTLDSLAVGANGATLATATGMNNNNSWEGTIDIKELSGSGDLIVCSGSNTSAATTFVVSGGTTYNGTVKVQNNGGSGRRTDLRISSDTALANAVIELSGTGTGNSGATNIVVGHTSAAVAGIKDAADRTAASGNVICERSTNTYTLTIDTGAESYETKSGVDASINLVKKGSGTQTFGGNMANFGTNPANKDEAAQGPDGTIEIQGGRLAFTKTDGTMTVAALTLNGGYLDVTNSVTLNAVTVDFSKYFDATKLEDKTYSVDLVTAGTLSITDWTAAQTGTYTADGTEYTTTVDMSDNKLVLTFKGPDDVVDPGITSLVVGDLSLNGTQLTLAIGQDLTGMTGAIDLTLSDFALDKLAGLPAGEVSLLLQGIAGDPIDSLVYGADISFYGSYVGDGGWYKVEYIPEPASATLSLAALMMLAARRRRRA